MMAEKSHDNMDQALEYLYSHVLLPRQVPGRSDDDFTQGDSALIDLALRSAYACRDLGSPGQKDEWDNVCSTIDRFKDLHATDGTLSSESMQDALQALPRGHAIILYFKTQNSALLFRHEGTYFHVESFEASPPAAQVLAAEGALKWDFPSRALQVPDSVFRESNFLSSLTQFLEQASTESLKEFAATTLKARSSTYESRDTCDPALIGQLLMAILEAYGSKTRFESTAKRVYDEVCFSEGAGRPWRRSALWLVLRIGLHRQFCFLCGGVAGQFQYKLFACMAFMILCKALSGASAPLGDLSYAQRRLGRRAAKLQLWGKKSGILDEGSLHLLNRYEQEYSKTLRALSEQLNNAWTLTQRRTTKIIKPIPRRADFESVHLRLAHSRATLVGIMDEVSFLRHVKPTRLPHRLRRTLQHSTWSTRKFDNVKSLADFLDLAAVEDDLQSRIRHRGVAPPEQECHELLDQMKGYLDTARNAYRADPEKSSMMLLLLLEMWQAIDGYAIDTFPLLAKYNHGFPPDMFYVLQIARLCDMKRLRKVEDYLEIRTSRADKSLPSIFDEIKENSFQLRYFHQCKAMKRELVRINELNATMKAEKHKEWERKSQNYTEIKEEILRTPCMYTEEDDERVHDQKCCRKCYLKRVLRRMAIETHEDLLPADEIQAKALVFELNLPGLFAIWRDATWLMLCLGRPEASPDQGIMVRLGEVPHVNVLMKTHESSFTVGLASPKKPFRLTHYAKTHLPVAFEDICHPHGPHYSLLDSQRRHWTAQRDKELSLAGFCGSSLPRDSSYTSLKRYLHPVFEGELVTPNSVVANQTRCPNALSDAEYAAFQALRMGHHIQWIQLLRELASSNLNFGAVEVCALVMRVTLQAGPPLGRSVLRASHWVAEDAHFLDALLGQIRRRLVAIEANWRESQSLACLLVIIERIWHLCPSTASQRRVEELMLEVRTVTHTWIEQLRHEINDTTDAETGSKRSHDAFYAALICRRTFVLEAASPDVVMDPEALACFLECAFTVKDNFPLRDAENLFELGDTFRNLYVSDVRLVRSLEQTLRNSIHCHQPSVTRAVNSVLSVGNQNTVFTFTSWQFQPKPGDDWVTARSSAEHGLLAQEVCFDILSGSLLVDGEPAGRLPESYCSQNFFQRFFKNRVFRTVRSGLPNTIYRLSTPYKQHEIYFGIRGDCPFLRVRTVDRKILEYVPPEIFMPAKGTEHPDLPWPLLETHVHWLDISSRALIIRPEHDMWHGKPSDWVVNLRTLQAWRRKSLLVDPSSKIFSTIVSTLEPFEDSRGVVIHQPLAGNVRLQLTKLELSFKVDSEGLLECQQLNSTVDPNQDAGTFYGLKSSLVLRGTADPQDRSILVAIGEARLDQQWGHPHIVIVHRGYYARYHINTVLGRLECPCEPRLMYFKAYCHALTSSAMPDPLTRKTGTEEAVQCLRAGNAQPWKPLGVGTYNILPWIADLTPGRFYYPQDVKVLQTVAWKRGPSTDFQDDDLRPLVNELTEQCEVLEDFEPKDTRISSTETVGDAHLLQRTRLRYKRFRPVRDGEHSTSASDRAYIARDCADRPGSGNAFEATSLVIRWRQSNCATENLASLLMKPAIVQGFAEAFDTTLLSDLIRMDIASSWGPIFTLCRNITRDEKHILSFLFAFLAFTHSADMSIIRILIMVAISQDIKWEPLPDVSTVHGFHQDEKPTTDSLLSLSDQFRCPYICDEGIQNGHTGIKKRRKLEADQVNHEEQSEKSCNAFVLHLVQQWPTNELTLDGLGELPLFESESALALIAEEWSRLHNNMLFGQHLERVRIVLERCDASVEPIAYAATENARTYPTLPKIQVVLPSMSALVDRDPGPSGQIISDDVLICTSISDNGITKDLQRSKCTDLQSSGRLDNPDEVPVPVVPRIEKDLHTIIGELTWDMDATRLAYGSDLQRSLNAYDEKSSSQGGPAHPVTTEMDALKLSDRIALFEDSAAHLFNAICGVLAETHDEFKNGRLLPSLSNTDLLRHLRLYEHHRQHKHPIWDALISYGKIVRSLQHLLRISTAMKRKDNLRLEDEIRNGLHDTQTSKQNMDWLLLEIDFNFRIRKDQYMVAQAMISPAEGSNFVLQMNMGQGKSSVVIPMIILCLADSKHLVRVVVPRALLQQTAQLLQGRLGGLLGRKIKHLPFSRKSPTAIAHIETYRRVHTDVCQTGGVILTLPEHILSFKLSGLQELSNGRYAEARYMMEMQAWLDTICKDVLDECDHMLDVKTQLIYPSGAQNTVDGHPRRWTVVQELLKMSISIMTQLKNDFPKDVQIIERRPGSFPTIYLLDDAVRSSFMDQLTDSILKGGGNIFPIAKFSIEELECIRTYLRENRISKDIVSKTFSSSRRTDSRNEVLILRGLLLHRILLLGLSKRWNVQYGIHPQRDPVAVPFRSKGIPSDQAEFGHPDVSIVLTCLSFYYSGLDPPQFQQALADLLRSDEPLSEYESWCCQVPDFPTSLQTWNAINVEDKTQMTQLFGLLRLQMPVINYYLNHFVFPRHARTFTRKIVSSAWDLILPGGSNHQLKRESSIDLDVSRSLTVGFSGTNDNKVLLPLNVRQNDLPSLAHTNAEVLIHLLQRRNRGYLLAANRHGKRISETEILAKLESHRIRMLLDAGAQILEHDNVSLVKAWLKVDTEAEAGVYFSQDGVAMVWFRHGKNQPLSASPFLDNLDRCVVYLDEAHTRGVDLKMPANAKAALTLGIMQTKDHTVQGKPNQPPQEGPQYWLDGRLICV